MSWQEQAIKLYAEGFNKAEIGRKLGIARTTVRDFLHRRQEQQYQDWKNSTQEPVVKKGPKILFFDIETRQLTLEGFGLFNQNFSLEQIAEDWSILSFSAKWMDSDEIMYYDVSEYTEDNLLDKLYDLFEEADFICAHNGKRFDLKKVRARMIARGFKPHSPVRVIDTLLIAKKEFAMTSNKLQYLTNLLCKSNKKSSHTKFPGFSLWREFVRGNPEAIEEMRSYNIIDVTSLQELYEILAPWSSTLPVFEVYEEDVSDMGDWEESGFSYTNLGKYQQYRNKITGQYRRGKTNLLSKEKRESLLANIV